MPEDLTDWQDQMYQNYRLLVMRSERKPGRWIWCVYARNALVPLHQRREEHKKWYEEEVTQSRHENRWFLNERLAPTLLKGTGTYRRVVEVGSARSEKMALAKGSNAYRRLRSEALAEFRRENSRKQSIQVLGGANLQPVDNDNR